jgi:hypothetical protein
MTQQKTPSLVLFAAIFALLTPLAHADQGGFTNSGGGLSVASGFSISSSAVASPAGTLTLTCSGASPCSGGSLVFQSADGTTSINAVFTTGTYSEGCSGGGRGGHITCSWSFTGSFSGTLTVNGAAQAINGATSQYFSASGGGGSGTLGYNSAYTPFYYSDTGQILRSDDLMGTNQIAYGTTGSGVGQFYGAYGIALDSAGRIYVADTYNCRIVRIDNMNGTNWTEYDSAGGCGSGTGQIYEPTGIAVDTLGRIYVTDPYNAQIIRMDDLTGANWTVFNSIGSGTGQINTFTNITVDSSNRIYIADGGNSRIVRMDDMLGTNFIALTQSQPVGPYIYKFANPVALALDPTGRIYIADYAGAAEVIRVDDMTGANWSSIYVSPVGSGGLNSIAVDSTGIVMTGGGGAKIIDNQTAVLNSSGSVAPVGSYYIFGVTPVPLPPGPRPSAISFNPTALNFSQNIGTSATLPVVITNFGGSPLNFNGLSATGGFTEADTCTGPLAPGATCTANVTYAPLVAGSSSGALLVTDDSFNQGTGQAVPLTGLATAPVASVSPTSLSFQSQVIGSTSSARNVTVTNTGNGPLAFTSILASAPFYQTNTCSTVAAGGTCTVAVTFTPTAIGTASGSLTLSDNAGTQTVALTGTGSAPVTLSSSTLNFNSIVVGTTSSTRTVSVSNRQNVTLNFSSIMITGAGFAIVSNTCGTSIAAHASCSVGVTFTPAATGASSGSLTFNDDAPNSPQTVGLSGSGTAPVTLSTSTLNFGTVTVGTTSSPRSVTLTNRSSSPLSFTSIATSAGFNLSANTCGAGIAAGATCSVSVTFSPTVTGAASGTLTFTDGAINSPQTVTLTGTGSTFTNNN